MNTAILRWARETSGLQPEDAARALGVASERLLRIELGEIEPPYGLLQKMVAQYKRPLVTFYLDKPPVADDTGHDFRTLPADRSLRDEGRVAALVRDIKARQGLLRSAIEDDEDTEPIQAIGSASMQDGVQTVVGAISRTLEFTREQFRSARNIEEAFNSLRTSVEKAGIYVLLVGDLGSHHSAIPVESFRGIAIADRIAPFIVINDKDAKSAWAFTLMHELAHLWIGESGISAGYSETSVEVFCNNVAGEFFVSAQEFNGIAWSDDITTLLSQVGDFAAPRKISKQMVLYRLLKFGKVTPRLWAAAETARKEEWLHEQFRLKENRRDTASGPSYYVVRRHRLGGALIETVKRSLASGSLSTAKAARVLGVNARAVQPLLEVQQ